MAYRGRVDDFLVDRVLLAVEQIPSGRVVAYGDIARLVGTSPRRVGSIMASHGGQVTWWRVVGASGDPGGNLIGRARPHWSAEGITVKPNGLGCRIADYRADLDELVDGPTDLDESRAGEVAVAAALDQQQALERNLKLLPAQQ